MAFHAFHNLSFHGLLFAGIALDAAMRRHISTTQVAQCAARPRKLLTMKHPEANLVVLRRAHR